MIRLMGIIGALAATAALSGCAEPGPPPVNVPPPAGPTACDAALVQNYLGQPISSFTLSEIRTNSHSQMVRSLAPNQAATMDFRPDRVTVVVDGNNVITKISCG